MTTFTRKWPKLLHRKRIAGTIKVKQVHWILFRENLFMSINPTPMFLIKIGMVQPNGNCHEMGKSLFFNFGNFSAITIGENNGSLEREPFVLLPFCQTEFRLWT